ncbi:MAG: hypothetical protein WDZ79_00525 [Candidatus Paceibacterota bacterium]
MKPWVKDNLALVVALALPVVLIAVIVVLVYVPRLFAPVPQYDFLYGVPKNVWPDRNCSIDYEVASGTFIEQRTVSGCEEGQTPTPVRDLYVYRVGEGERETLSYEEARNLNLDTRDMSPDGYILTRYSNNRGIFDLFGVPRDSGWHLERGGVQHSIELGDRSSRYYYYDVDFYGWIIN